MIYVINFRRSYCKGRLLAWYYRLSVYPSVCMWWCLLWCLGSM